ncbi:RNA-binding protein 12-like isoform X2 [Panonychus citri]|uniref:RNA-binding protein 12-like isoform X2 n=1 Tax=Panonychus citri TaxID=50023 RepID=UPI002306F16A|nr:RNA-binding protein 12-like isoform X2 [Panonychus citri]
MSIIIRLQNLPWEANSLDIRRYFQGLSIPDGGVHIVGGDKGDAFIAFSSDEDARQAMERDGGPIKDSRVKLYLSSRNEMQKVIEQARTQTLGIKGNDTGPPTVGGGGSSHLIGKQVNQPPSSVLHPPNHHGPEPVGPPGMVNYPTISNVTNQPGNYAEADLHRRSSERDISRGIGDRSRNRSRSRSPLYSRGGPVGDHLNHAHPSSGPYNHRIHGGPGGMGHMDDSRGKPDSIPGYGQVPVRSGLEGPPPSRPSGYGGGSNIALGPNSGQDISSGPGGGGGWLSRESDNFDNRPKAPGGDPRLASAQVKSYGEPHHPHLPPPSHGGPSHGPPLNHQNFSVELRGLSFNVAPRDIQEFFRQVGVYLHEEAIKILVDDRGYTTGGAIVRCANVRDYEAALAKHGSFMGDRRIDVMPLPETLNEDFTRGPGGNNGPPIGMGHGPQSIPSPPIGGNGQSTGRPPAGYQPSPSHEPLPPQQDYVIYMKGIPYNSCTEPDVAEFFSGLRFIDIVFEIDGRTGKPAGNAFVEFATNEDFNSALDMNMKHMGRRYIEVFPTTKDDMNDARMLQDRSSGGGGHLPPGRGGGGTSSGSGSGGPTFCVSVTNLPPTITNRDLTNYFSEIGAQPFAIHIMLKANGLNAGEAFVEFSSKDQQMKAVRKDGTFMEGQRISVRSVPHDLMRRVVGIPPPGGHGPPGAPMNNGGMDGPMRHGGNGGGGGGGGNGTGGPMFPHGDMGGDPRKMRRGGREDGFRGRRGEKDGRRGGNDGPHQGGNYNSFADHRLRY